MGDNGKQKRKFSPVAESGRILPVAALLTMALAVGVAIFYHHKYQSQRDEAQKQAILAAGFKEQVDRALDQAVELQHQLHAAKDEEKSLQAQRDDAVAEVRKSSEQLKKDLVALESAEADVEKLRTKAKILEQTINTADAALQLAQRERDAANRSLETAKKDITAAHEEAASARAELAKASIQLGEMKRRQEQVRADAAKELEAARQAYSAALDSLAGGHVIQQSGGMSGLAGVQAAARRANALPRLADLRLAARGEKTRDLLNKIEAVLTRLDMLNPAETGQDKAFATLVGAELISQIDQALLEGAEKPNLLRLLLDVRLILSGAKHGP